MELKGTSIFVKRQLDGGLSLTLFVVQSLVAKKSTFKKKNCPTLFCIHNQSIKTNIYFGKSKKVAITIASRTFKKIRCKSKKSNYSTTNRKKMHIYIELKRD